MSIDLSGLSKFSQTEDAPAPKRGGKGTEKTWQPPADISEYATGQFLCWDQSLSATGWTYLINTGKHILVQEAGSFGGTHGTEGYENVLLTADEVRLGMSMVLMRYAVADPRTPQPITVVFEAVPAGGGKFIKKDLALLSTYLIRHEAAINAFPLAPMMAAQTHKRLVCGNGRADKKEEHRALERLVPAIPIYNYEKITNEAKRDALCVGLGHMLREGNDGSH